MNISIVRYLLGQILKVEAILLLFPFIVACIYREKAGLCFVAVAAVSALLGILLAAQNQKTMFFT